MNQDQTASKARSVSKVLRLLFLMLLAVIGGGLLAGGVRLLMLGGSPYYVFAAACILGAMVLLWLKKAGAAASYALMLAMTVVWALIDCGLDAWALAGRIAALCVVGLPFLLRSIRGPKQVDKWASLFGPTLLIAVIVNFVLPIGQSAAISFPLPKFPYPGRSDWPVWGGDNSGTRFSTLQQITPANVEQLEVAWTYHLGIPADGQAGNLEITPLEVADRVYVCNTMSMVDALDADTGKRLWRFDPKVDVSHILARTCRGVAYHESASTVCPKRIITSTMDAKLWALDAITGAPCEDFGRGGMVDLSEGMGSIDDGYYYPTSAPVIVHGNIVVGGWVFDGQKIQSPPGVVRAYSVLTGRFAWAWDIGRPHMHAAPPVGSTYTLGTPNSWAPMSADETLGLVYLPTGNATPDYYGGQRTENMDRYSSSIVALDAATGDVRWSFQTVHHDVWDYDVSSQPTLVDLQVKGEKVPALVQATKQGEIFVLDRRDGKPLTEVEERAVPQSNVPGERHATTQPRSVGMPSLSGPDLSESRMWGLTPFDQLWCRIQFRKAAYDGRFTPPRVGQTSIESPGFMGAVSWGGVSIDPTRGWLLVNSMRIATLHELIPRSEADAMGLKALGTPNAKMIFGFAPQEGAPYAARLEGFVSPLLVPCTQPPYGMLTAIDLQSRRVVWERRLGTVRDSGVLGLHFKLPVEMGVPNVGGSLITQTGLAFIGATQEEQIRAVDIASGRILWNRALPAGGQASPMTYQSSGTGRQYLVIAAGGKFMLQTRLGDQLIAYALKQGSPAKSAMQHE